MSRFFIELFYKGTHYAGFQVQQNANTVQAEVEKALDVYFRKPFQLTGSSRTDAGVHALQNFFHFDEEQFNEAELQNGVYNLNAILPGDIVIRQIFQVADDMHARFSATSRTYRYQVYQVKDPFMEDRAFFYPYSLDPDLLEESAGLIRLFTDFESFSKRNTQVNTFDCNILKSTWEKTDTGFVYHVSANRFLRGMVRGLVGTMLKVGRKKSSISELEKIIISKDCSLVDFSVPPQGLMLMEVKY